MIRGQFCLLSWVVRVKIVAECKEYVLLETVATQDTQDRVFLFIPPKLDQKREKDQRSGLICAKRNSPWAKT